MDDVAATKKARRMLSDVRHAMETTDINMENMTSAIERFAVMVDEDVDILIGMVADDQRMDILTVRLASEHKRMDPFQEWERIKHSTALLEKTRREFTEKQAEASSADARLAALKRELADAKLAFYRLQEIAPWITERTVGFPSAIVNRPGRSMWDIRRLIPGVARAADAARQDGPDRVDAVRGIEAGVRLPVLREDIEKAISDQLRTTSQFEQTAAKLSIKEGDGVSRSRDVLESSILSAYRDGLPVISMVGLPDYNAASALSTSEQCFVVLQKLLDILKSAEAVLETGLSTPVTSTGFRNVVKVMNTGKIGSVMPVERGETFQTISKDYGDIGFRCYIAKLQVAQTIIRLGEVCTAYSNSTEANTGHAEPDSDDDTPVQGMRP